MSKASIAVSNQLAATAVPVRTQSGRQEWRKKLVMIPVLHHMAQYAELQDKFHRMGSVPSHYYRHRLIVTGERLVEGAGVDGGPKVMPVYKFIHRKMKSRKKLDRCFPRGKAYGRVMDLARNRAAAVKAGVE